MRTTKSSSAEQTVTFKPPIINLGTVLQGQIVRRHFRLFNRGNKDAHLYATQSSCGCTIITEALNGAVIPVHGSLIVPVEYNSGLSEGPISQTVKVFFETQGRHYYTAALLEGRINPDFKVAPRVLDFGARKPGELASQKFSIIVGALDDVKIIEVRCSGEFQISLPSNQTEALPGKPFEIRVIFKAPSCSSTRAFRGAVDIETSSRRVPRLSVPVFVMVTPEVEICPEVVVLSKEERSEITRFTIRSAEQSRIIRVLRLAEGDSAELIHKAFKAAFDEEFRSVHVVHVRNIYLANTKRLDFELEVRNRAGRKEARSVSVLISSL